MGENIQGSSDWQQIQLEFTWKKRKLRRFYHGMNNSCGRIMKVDGADKNHYALVYRPKFISSKRSFHSRLSVGWQHLWANCGFHLGTIIRWGTETTNPEEFKICQNLSHNHMIKYYSFTRHQNKYEMPFLKTLPL